MKRSFLDSLVLEKSLAVVNGHDCGDLLEFAPPDAGFRNVCAKVAPKLAEDIADVCATLDIRQRRFVEAALLDAVRRAQTIIEEEGVHQAYEERAAAFADLEDGAEYDPRLELVVSAPRSSTVEG